ncbi:hypothetical protein I4F81_007640 [Pyropia yezoensis]|uniref:Uncharacterized protein n=1 Tax=Pyropia yezoensis TaxID=2788 RepID=A0ACC3C4R5_PYRYE|nr:hypothetical protein I4F81_007640 [Neopyropia yezoensis]
MGRHGVGGGRPRGLRAASATASYGAIPPASSGRGRDTAAPDVEAAAAAAATAAAAAEAAASVPPVSASQTLRFVAPWLVPRTLRLRAFAVASLTLTLCSKACNFVGPLFLRAAVDGLAGTPVGSAGGSGAPPLPAPTATLGGWVLSPVVAVVGYVAARLGATAFSQAQSLTWAVVSLATTRHFSVVTFAHLHALSLSWHLHRRTGEVLRVMDRGVSSLATLLSLVSFNLLPTALELCLVVGVFFHLRSPAIAVVTVFTVVAYAVYSVVITAWRLPFRRAVNDADNRVSDAAVDSLLNYETVKSFGAEAGEVSRYAALLRRFQNVSLVSAGSLVALNGGQAAVLNVGLAVTLALAAARVATGDLTVGDLVAINAYVLQLFAPLAWLGMAWRSLQTATTDLERLVALHTVRPLVVDVPGAPALRVDGGSVVFDNVDIAAAVEVAQLDAFVKAAPAGLNTLVVAHAQEILVMEGGRVVERGNHEALVGREGGVYARLWALQSTSRDQGASRPEGEDAVQGGGSQGGGH